MRKIFALLLLQFCLTEAVLADQYDEESAIRAPRPAAPVKDRQADSHGSDAVFDKRLPPVIPGEEMKDGNKTIKVWSTSGPVYVDHPPDHSRSYGNSLEIGENVDIIVDERNRDAHHKHPHHDPGER